MKRIGLIVLVGIALAAGLALKSNPTVVFGSKGVKLPPPPPPIPCGGMVTPVNPNVPPAQPTGQTSTSQTDSLPH